MKRKTPTKQLELRSAFLILMTAFTLTALLNGCVKKEDFNALDSSDNRQTSNSSLTETAFFKGNKSQILNKL